MAMDEFEEFARLALGSLQNSNNLIQTLGKEKAAYRKLFEDFTSTVTDLTEQMEQQSRDRNRRRRFRWSVAVTAATLGVLGILWSSTLGIGFVRTLLESVGGALITFGLVEVVLNSIVEIPTRTAIKQDKIVSLLRTGTEKATTIVRDLLSNTATNDEELAKFYVELDALISSTNL